MALMLILLCSNTALGLSFNVYTKIKLPLEVHSISKAFIISNKLEHYYSVLYF